MLTQAQRVLAYMQDFGSITTYQAFVDLGVTRLSAHIFNLRKMGYIIKSDKVCVKNRYGQKTYVSEYQLLGEDKNAIISS